MATRKPPPLPDTQQYNRVIAGLTAVAFAGASQAQGFPLIVVAAGLALLGPALMLGRLSLSASYHRSWRIAAAIVAFGAFMDVTAGGLPTVWGLLGILGVCLLGCLANKRTHRGVLTCWILSTAMVCLECLEAGSPGILVFMLAWSLLSVRLFMKFASDRARLEVAVAPAAASPASPRLLPLVPAIFMLAAAVFLALPRTGRMEETWRAAMQAQERRAAMLRSGFSSQIDLNALTRIHSEQGVALRVRNLPASLRDDGLRLRIATLDAFTGESWIHSGAGADWEMRNLARDGSAYRLDLQPPGDTTRESQIELTIVPGEYNARGIALPEGTVSVFLPVPRAITESDGSVTLADSAAVAPWTVRVTPGLPSKEALSDASESMCLQRAAWNRPRDVAKLLDTILAGETDSPAKAAKLRSWLRRVGQYTASPGIKEHGISAVEEFLFRPTLAGHCELYATTMALLAREAGIPSRIVTGYGGGEFEAESGDLLVSHQDAHAWTELYFEGQGWLPFDATPARPLSASGDRFFFSQTRGWLAAGGDRVRDWLQGYDQQVQRKLVALSFGKAKNAVESVDSGLIPRTFRRMARNITEPTILALGLVLCVLNILAYMIHRRLRHSRNQKKPPTKRIGSRPGHAPEILLELLSALGCPGTSAGLKGSKTPVELLRTAAATAGLDPSDAEGLTSLYSRWRFAGDDAAGLELRRWLKGRRRKS